MDYHLSTDLKFQYDALNRVTNMVDASGTTKFTYGQGHLVTEDGPWADDTISYTYQNGLRRTLKIINAGSGSVVITNSYDAMQRLASVANPAGSFGYQHAGAANLVRKLSLPGGSYVTNQFDTLGRITDTRLLDPTSAVLNRHGYKYNTAHQRTFLSRTNAAYSSCSGYLTNTYDAF